MYRAHVPRVNLIHCRRDDLSRRLLGLREKIVREGHSTLALRRRLSSFRIAAASSWVIPMARALSGEVRRARLTIHSWCSLEVFSIVVTPVCRKPQDRTVEAPRFRDTEEDFRNSLLEIVAPRTQIFQSDYFVRGYINLAEIAADSRAATFRRVLSFH